MEPSSTSPDSETGEDITFVTQKVTTQTEEIEHVDLHTKLKRETSTPKNVDTLDIKDHNELQNISTETFSTMASDEEDVAPISAYRERLALSGGDVEPYSSREIDEKKSEAKEPAGTYHTITGGPETLKDAQVKQEEVLVHKTTPFSTIGMNSITPGVGKFIKNEILLSSVLFRFLLILNIMLYGLYLGSSSIVSYLVTQQYLLPIDGGGYIVNQVTVPHNVSLYVLLFAVGVTLLSVLAVILAAIVDYWVNVKTGIISRIIILASLMTMVSLITRHLLTEKGIDLLTIMTTWITAFN